MTNVAEPGAYECDAILFDLDGVLVDSAATIERLWTRWARRHGLDPAEVLRQTPGRPAAATIAAVGPHLDAAVEAAGLEGDQVDGLTELRSIPGAQAITRALPWERWGVVTSGSRFVATTRLRTVGIGPPTVLVTADDVTSGKPDPEGYRAGAAGLGVDAKRCVVVEDAHTGVRAASAAGMAVVGVTGPGLGPEDGLLFTVRDLTDLQVVAYASGRLGVQRAQTPELSP